MVRRRYADIHVIALGITISDHLDDYIDVVVTYVITVDRDITEIIKGTGSYGVNGA